METCQVFLFGDLTIHFEEDCRQLLHIKTSGTLSSFLDQVAFALREEFGSLASREQELFPHFTTLIDLLSRLKGSPGAPALRFTLLCLYQVGQFIRHHEESSRSYPDSKNTFLVGICTGSFAAAAISTSRTLSELVPAGVEVVLAAFRTALRSLIVGYDIQRPAQEIANSWSAVVGVPESLAIQSIEAFNAGKLLPPNSRPYLSAVAPKNATISGPPNVLRDFFSADLHDPYYLSIDSPYHAPGLFGASDVEEVIDQINEEQVQSHAPRLPFLSAYSGETLSASSLKELLGKVVTETLCQRIDWTKILSFFTTRAFQTKNFKRCLICPVASNAAHLLQTSLSEITEMEFAISDRSGLASSSAPPPRPTGKFEQSKIAIVGYSGRFPESASVQEFWKLLHAGRDVHRTIPEDRFDWRKHFDATGKTKNTSKVQYGCFIKEPGAFDARFFNMSPKESENTDPAQRLAITSTYEALEMAGMVLNRTPSTQQDRIGVFFGTTSDDWREVNSGQDVNTYFIPGGNRAFVPGRISYYFRFCGPSLSIDTACSSSFAAIQTACSYLWKGDVDTAVAGGTNVLTNPDNFSGLDRGHFLSTTGNCNTFDDEASGYCRSDAVGSVVLKRLEDAQADNDPIFGVILGATTNHCGQTDSITRPHEGDQLSVFNRIMRHANVSPLDVSYIEMHGTGTQSGDATEMKSVLSAFVPGRERMPRYPLYLGSAKANIGHAESASGVASLIKMLTMMKMNEIPPHCGIKTKINHNYPLDLQQRNVNIAYEPSPWYRSDFSSGKRTVFLNNFSAAGGNTAVLLEDAPPLTLQDDKVDPRTVHLLTVTAKTPKALDGNINAMLNFLTSNPATPLSALSYTTTARRLQHNYRTICSGSDVTSICDALRIKYLESNKKAIPPANKMAKIVLVFSGQGSIYVGIAKQIYGAISLFTADIQRFNRIAQQQGFASFLPLIDGTASDEMVNDPVIAHLALTCTQIALSCLWASWGISPTATVGHSLGEYAALCTAGVLTASDTIYLVGTRAQLLSRRCVKDSNGMLVVKATIPFIQQTIAGSSCEIACMNQPMSNVISGPIEEITSLQKKLQLLGYESVKLKLPYAFHSAHVDPILDDLRAAAENIRFSKPRIPYMSPLLAELVSDAETLDASYIIQACRSPVNFQGALEAAKLSLALDEHTIWLEIGSQPTCSDMVKGILGSQANTLSTLKKHTNTWKVLANSLEHFFQSGINIHWNEYHRDFSGSHVVIDLPTYSWDLKNYWIQYRNDFCLTKGDDSGLEQIVAAPAEQKRTPKYLSPSVQRVVEEDDVADVSTLLVETDINDSRLAYVIQGHQVNSVALCPSSLYADMAMTIADYMLQKRDSAGDRPSLDVADMRVERPLISVTPSAQILRVSARADWSANTIPLSFYTVSTQGTKIADHARCVVRISPKQTWLQDWKRNSYLIGSRIQALHASVDNGNAHKMKRGIVYKLFTALVAYSSAYQGMQEVVLDSEGLEATSMVSFGVEEDGFFFHPCWIDSLGHIAGFIMNGNDNVQSKDQVFINHGWESMRCATSFSRGRHYRAYNKMQLESGTMYVGDTYVLDGDAIVAIFEGVKFQGVPRSVIDQLITAKNSLSRRKEKGDAPAATPSQPTAQSKAREPTKDPKRSEPIAESATQPPVTDVAQRAMKIIAEEAGLDVAELVPNVELADLGIDSLLTLTILGRLQEEMNLEVDPTLFAESLTVKDLRAHFSRKEQDPGSPESSGDDPLSTPASDSASESFQTDASSISGTDDIIECIRITISDEAGIDVNDLKPSTSFSELGMDSLLTLTVMGKLSETLEAEIPQTLLTDNDTLDEVESALKRTSGGSKSTEPGCKKATQAITAGLDVPLCATSVLLQGNPRSARKTLFLFPDGSGSATSYAALPKIASDTVVYGLNCPWQKTPQDMNCSFEFAATTYISEVRRRQANGPYYFGGWSAGGILAFESAQQLAREGETTARLILIDSPNPVGLDNPPERMYDFLETLDFFGTKGKAPPSWLRPHFNAFLNTLDNYKVRPFVGLSLQTHIVYARDGICKNPSDPRPEIRPSDPREMLWLLNNRTDFSGAGWASLVGKENLKVHVLDDVNHFSMVAPGPKIAELSSFIERAML